MKTSSKVLNSALLPEWEAVSPPGSRAPHAAIEAALGFLRGEVSAQDMVTAGRAAELEADKLSGGRFGPGSSPSARAAAIVASIAAFEPTRPGYAPKCKDVLQEALRAVRMGFSYSKAPQAQSQQTYDNLISIVKDMLAEAVFGESLQG